MGTIKNDRLNQSSSAAHHPVSEIVFYNEASISSSGAVTKSNTQIQNQSRPFYFLFPAVRSDETSKGFLQKNSPFIVDWQL